MLVVAQIALSVILLVGAGLLAKSFLSVVPVDPGFAMQNRATVLVTLRAATAFPDRVTMRRFIADVSDRMRRVRGVRDVAAMSFPPFYRAVSVADIEVPGRPAPDRPFTAYMNLVTPNYFGVMEIPLRRGRAFTTSDIEGAQPVVVINETAAERWWPKENPIGRPVTWGRLKERVNAIVVGVARDGRMEGTDTRFRPELFVPVAQGSPRFATFIAHTSVDPRSLSPDLKRAVWAVNPRLPVGTASDLTTMASESLRAHRFFSVAMSLFAVAAIVLAACAPAFQAVRVDPIRTLRA